MNLRRHQQDFNNIISGIIEGSSIETIICECTPGSGKSLLPIIAGRLITAGLANALCWIVPRKTLQFQGEANFQDPVFRKILNHKLTIRASTNEINPCRGLDGIITTYQALSMDERHTVSNDFSFKRYILVMDENQHVEEDGLWNKALQPLVNKAKYLVLMTGTAMRGNGTSIAFMPDISHDSVARIKYSRKDALKEKAIIPLHFSFSDGNAKWIEYDGQEIECDSIAKMPRKDVAKAVYTAISTDYADSLMSKGLQHWTDHKKRHPSSKLLIVTANVELAKRALGFLQGKYRVSTEIATSHESAAAQTAIKKFKAGLIDILVGVAMFYEGFDCKQVSHIIALTHIRSRPWLEQMFARAVRVDPQAGDYKTQCAYIFSPDDPVLRSVVSMIESEQTPFVKKQIAQNQELLFDDKGNSPDKEIGDNAMYGIIPIDSELTGNREIFLGNKDIAPDKIIPQTPSEIERSLRDQIENHVRQFSFVNRYKPQRINSEIKTFFEKPRDIMTVPELTATLEHVKNAYPLGGGHALLHQYGDYAKVRGGGIRVPTRAVAWQE